MTRQKKSRKPGTLGTKSTPKNLRERKTPEAGKAPQRSKGKPAGNRHSVETKNSQQRNSTPPQTHDPRVGSKRKIPLTVPKTDAVTKSGKRPTAKVKAQPEVMQPVDVSEDAMRLAEDEFARLENDPRLQDLLAQLDAGDKLTPSDQAWVDSQLKRYQALAHQLGIEEEDEDDLEPWQRFENPKDWL